MQNKGLSLFFNAILIFMIICVLIIGASSYLLFTSNSVDAPQSQSEVVCDD